MNTPAFWNWLQLLAWVYLRDIKVVNEAVWIEEEDERREKSRGETDAPPNLRSGHWIDASFMLESQKRYSELEEAKIDIYEKLRARALSSSGVASGGISEITAYEWAHLIVGEDERDTGTSRYRAVRHEGATP